MLVVTRKAEEGVRIGEDVEVRVLGVHRRRVRLGITAPSDVPVLREELAVCPSARTSGSRVPAAG